ncbi:MAG: TIM barrel protein [Planctomycetaceae bacterium]|nr:TIM barrel protein [Planctomycetaceae bacterium]
MKFSFLTYQFCRYPLEYCFDVARKYGFDGVEVWGARPHAYAYDMTPDAIREVNGWREQYGVEVSMFTPEILAYPYSLASRSRKEFLETVAYLIKSAEVAAAIGARYMQITAPHPGYRIDREAVWNQLADGVGQLCSRAEAVGVDVLMESLTPSEGNLITTAADLKRLIDHVGSPALKGMLDVVPPVIANEPFDEYFWALRDRMAYVHLCNSDGVSEYHAQLDATGGVIPLRELFILLKNRRYDGWCSMELLAPYFKDPELYLVESARSLAGICRDVGIEANLLKNS